LGTLVADDHHVLIPYRMERCAWSVPSTHAEQLVRLLSDCDTGAWGDALWSVAAFLPEEAAVLAFEQLSPRLDVPILRLAGAALLDSIPDDERPRAVARLLVRLDRESERWEDVGAFVHLASHEPDYVGRDLAGLNSCPAEVAGSWRACGPTSPASAWTAPMIKSTAGGSLSSWRSTSPALVWGCCRS
jgi:hypothetical protein